jgi:hypothetical protein
LHGFWIVLDEKIEWFSTENRLSLVEIAIGQDGKDSTGTQKWLWAKRL